jgi:hypothetical protein
LTVVVTTLSDCLRHWILPLLMPNQSEWQI